MRSSASSSATGITPPPARPSRDGFALTGRSRLLDPRTHAVRSDIADVRLADRVFAPHYAAPLRRSVVSDVELRAGRSGDSPVVTRLTRDAAFDLFDVTGGIAWGIAVDDNLVGYLDAAAVGLR